MSYPPFRKDFYFEAPEIRNMTPQAVENYRRELGNVQINGVDCPRPVRKWSQLGASLCE